jgi:1-deoxy-D-xylulose-5-phosphate synthase
MSRRPQRLLDGVDSPAELRDLPESSLPLLAHELRQFLLQTVAGSGGHLASGLGTVELGIGLHYVFDTPRDALVWDVGHQAYPHKVLTGRRDRLHTLRKRDGLSGFLRRDESPFDAFGAGHSSTSISAALGMALAGRALERRSHTVAVIGDGALTAGLAYEALQQAGALPDLDLVVVLNDNGMSISPNVGSLAHTLRSSGDAVDEDERTAAGAFFRGLGLQYHGPCDGHDLPSLVAALRAIRDANGPRVLHVRTRKGHGYERAERDPVRYHGVTAFDTAAGLPAAATPSLPTYTDVFGEWICAAAARDRRLHAVTPAMREGSGLVRFAREFPDRYFDVGIAEQHSVALAAGLACRGAHPVVAIYSTFLQRAYDQLLHDVALQRLPVLFAVDRAGLVGPDGATHNGAFDLSFLRCVPGMVIMAPSDGNELQDMLHTGLSHPGPAAVRYPRCPVPAALNAREPRAIPLGTAEMRRIGNGGVAVLAFGTLLGDALAVAESLDATVVNMRFVKPLDETVVLDVARHHDLVVTLEENAIAGGAGSAVQECLAARHVHVPVLSLGLPDAWIEHATRAEALHDARLDRDSIEHAIRSRLAQRVPRPLRQAETRRAGGVRRIAVAQQAVVD